MEIQFHDPPGAYLTGMLHDIGSLALATCFSGRFSLFSSSDSANVNNTDAEHNQGERDHCRAGSWLVYRYTGCSFMADAIGYHHSLPERIAQAFPLVQIVYVANLLAQTDKVKLESGYAAAEAILGLDTAQTDELVLYAAVETDAACHELIIEETQSNQTKSTEAVGKKA